MWFGVGHGIRLGARFLLMALVVAACSSDDGRDVTASNATAGTESPSPTLADDVDTVPTAVVPASPTSSGAASPPTLDPDAEPAAPVGFETVSATVTTASGEVCELCLWVASTPQQRSQGLMGVTDLGAGDGMIFRYDTVTTTTFWMKNTPMQLSIAFFDADGAFMDAFDMEPCAVEPCPHYPTPRAFLDAIEFPQGTPDELGVGAGSVLAVGDVPCG